MPCCQHVTVPPTCLAFAVACACQEAKFRHIRLGNEKISSAIVEVAGALHFLSAVGFQVHAAEAGAASSSSTAADADDGGFAVFLDDSQLSLVEEGLLQLQLQQAALESQQAQQHNGLQQRASVTKQPQEVTASTHSSQTAATPATAAPAAAAAAAAAASSISTPRETQVLLPAAPDTEVPDWFFERTGAELKAEYLAIVKRRQTGEYHCSVESACVAISSRDCL
jgi:hypothetical protein